MLSRRRFDVQEYHRMVEAGILDVDDRVELLDGEVVEMHAIGSRHFACVIGLHRAFARRLPEDVLVSVQGPVRLDRYSEPEPDVAILHPRDDLYAEELPGPVDVYLLIEVADSSLLKDRTIKLPLYAAAGIPEVWIVDLTTDAVEVYRKPDADGYSACERVTAGTLAPAAFPEIELEVAEIVPPGR